MSSNFFSKGRSFDKGPPFAKSPCVRCVTLWHCRQIAFWVSSGVFRGLTTLKIYKKRILRQSHYRNRAIIYKTAAWQQLRRTVTQAPCLEAQYLFWIIHETYCGHPSHLVLRAPLLLDARSVAPVSVWGGVRGYRHTYLLTKPSGIWLYTRLSLDVTRQKTVLWRPCSATTQSGE